MVDIELYGGKRGLLEHIRACALNGLGVYGSVRAIEWRAVKRLVFVCRGNICRSPYASLKARSLGVHAISFGMEAADGTPADPVASHNALFRGVDLSTHRSARIESAHLSDGDVVIMFEPSQLAAFRRRFGDRPPACLLGIWSRPVRPHIQDPYGRSDRYFQRCFSVIDANIMELASRLVSAGAPATDHMAQKIPCANALHENPSDRTSL